jgi:hypothetical protein
VPTPCTHSMTSQPRMLRMQVLSEAGVELERVFFLDAITDRCDRTFMPAHIENGDRRRGRTFMICPS